MPPEREHPPGANRQGRRPERTLVVWCPDWPVAAAGHGPAIPAAVVAAERVVSTTAAARAEGVRLGLRRREAQGRCPELVVAAADAGRDARAFEPVVAAVEAFVSGVEILRPGVVALGTRGPSRYFGGDHRLAGEVAAAVDAAASRAVPGAVSCRVGVADGRFAAELAARAAGGGEVPALVVPAGGSAAFLAPWPVAALPHADLAGLLTRLGVVTLGGLAALPAASVLARFGEEGRVAHRLASGLDERPLAVRVPPEDLAVSQEIDPPAERVDLAAFVARSLAAELHDRLTSRGLVCTQVAIEAETEHRELLVRRWRHEGSLGVAAIAERLRWQLDGWLGGGGTGPAPVPGGLASLRLVPLEVCPEGGRQLDLWGGAAVDGGVGRSLSRVQGLLGPEGVVTAVLGGGRDPAGSVRLVPWGDPRTPARAGAPPVPEAPVARVPAGTRRRRRATGTGSPAVGGATRRRGRVGPPPPWPGRLPAPAPALTHPRAVPAELRDAGGQAVAVSGRGDVSAPPASLSIAGGGWSGIEAWAGPWPVEERWWEAGRRRARFQVVTGGGTAFLLSLEDGRWWLEATYD